MEILRKIIDCKSLENSQGNFYGGVSFSKVTTLQFSDCNFTIRIFITDSFREMDQKLAILKK